MDDNLIADGDVVHAFDRYGRHKATYSALTGATRHFFGYTSAGSFEVGRFVNRITDGDGKTTKLFRSEDNYIEAPGGQRTQFGLSTNGYLASVLNPANETTKPVVPRTPVSCPASRRLAT